MWPEQTRIKKTRGLILLYPHLTVGCLVVGLKLCFWSVATFCWDALSFVQRHVSIKCLPLGDKIWETGSPNKTSDVILSLRASLLLIQDKQKQLDFNVNRVVVNSSAKACGHTEGEAAQWYLSWWRKCDFSPCGKLKSFLKKTIGKNWYVVVNV